MFSYYIKAHPKAGGNAYRVGMEGRDVVLVRKVLLCSFWKHQEDAETMAAKLNAAPCGGEFVFTVVANG